MTDRAARRAVPTRVRLAVAVVAGLVAVGLLVAALAGAFGTDAAPRRPVAPVPGAASSPPVDETGTPADPEPTPEPSPARSTATAADVQVVATGLDVPWGIAVLPDGDLLVSLRDSARLVRVAPDGERAPVDGPGADELRETTVPGGEGGLLGVAVARTFPADGYVYVYRTGAEDNAILRGVLDGTTLGPLEMLVDGIPRAGNHDGGALAFGPDGRLYAGTGDAGTPEHAQDLDSLGGKILRIEPDGAVPADNPLPGSLVWTSGHRNVQGIGWDADGRMYASELGQDAFDELNEIVAGASYGWPDVEGAGGEAAGFADPLVTWSTDEASPSGIAVTADGVYVAALQGQRVWRVDLGTLVRGEPATPTVLLDGVGRVRNVVALPDGDLLVVTGSTDGRGDPGDDDDRLLRVRLQVTEVP